MKSLDELEATLRSAHRAVADYHAQRRDQVLDTVCRVMAVERDALLGAGKAGRLPWARAVAATLLFRRLQWTKGEIERLFHRAHPFTNYALQLAADRCETEPTAAREFSRVAFAFEDSLRHRP